LIPIAGRSLIPLLGAWVFGWLPMLTTIATAISWLNVVGNVIPLGTYEPKLALTMRALKNHLLEI